MKAYRIRAGTQYVQFVDAETGRVIFTNDRDEAGVFSERGAAEVWKMLEGVNVGMLEPVH